MKRVWWSVAVVLAAGLGAGVAMKQAEQAQVNCLARAPEHTDTAVEQQWEVCEKLLAHRRMIGR